VNREYRKWWSPALGRDMELLVFGDRGAPVLVFPTSMGRFYQWEDFGIVSHMGPRIDAGWIQLWCVDSVDGESFYNKKAAPQDRARRHAEAALPQHEAREGAQRNEQIDLAALQVGEQRKRDHRRDEDQDRGREQRARR